MSSEFPGSVPTSISVEGSDRLPSETASDWVTYADYVVIVHAAAEEVQKPTAGEVKRGEGSVLRKVTMTVDKVLWSSPSTKIAPPDGSFSYLAFGYAFTNGNFDRQTPMVANDEPRFEVGHTYIMALTWQADRCTPGDYVAGEWRGLGSDGALPFDGAVIGNGEFEGQSVKPFGYPRSFDAAEKPFIATLTGKSSSDLVSALRAAPVEQKGDYLPPPAPCTADHLPAGR